MRKNSVLFLVITLAIVFTAITGALALESDNVAVAASIYPCVAEMAKRFEEAGGKAPQFVPGASGNLAAQIQSGAPFGLYLSANVAWAKKLSEQGFLEELRPLASSPIVIWWNREETPPLGERLEDLTICIADPVAAPFGKAGKEYLDSIGLYDSMMKEKKIVIAGSVLKAALATDNGGSDASILSLSIALKMGKGQYQILPMPPLKNSGGLVKGNYSKNCESFWNFIRSPKMHISWENWGFKPTTND
nr:molybdate ABC transporter substrate-binding protein [uncultured Dethiosulfovibrio sp.]